MAIPRGGPTYGYVPPPTRVGGPQSPGWLYDEGAAAPSGGSPGRIPPGGGPEMLDTLTKVVTGITAIGLLGFLNHWARPTLKASKLQQHSGTWGWLQSVLNNIQAFLDHGTNHIGHAVSKGAAHAAAGPAHALDLFSLRWEQIVWNVAYLAHDTEHAIAQIIHHAIPHAVGTAVHPVKVEVKKLRRGVVVIVHEITTVKRYFKHIIVREIRPQIHHLTIITTKVLPREIRTIRKQATRTEIRVRQQTKTINKLLPLLTVVGATALVLKAFTRLGLNFLRCQNLKGFGEELCASPPGSGRKLGRFLRGLLSGIGGVLAPLFICQIFEAAVALAAPVMSKTVAVVGLAGAALCDNKHNAAAPLPLLVTADPPVRNAIAL